MFPTTMIFRIIVSAFCVVSLLFNVNAAPVFSQSNQKNLSDSTPKGTKNSNQPIFSDENIVDTGKVVAHPSLKPHDAVDSITKKLDSVGIALEKKNANALIPLPQFYRPDESLARMESINGEFFKTLGSYHRLMGAYEVISGVLTILAGVVLIDKEDAAPFAMSFIALGGISIGLGLWEIKVGAKLMNYKVPGK